MTRSGAEPSTRDRIVEAADALFYQRGFERTSFADIADSVRLSRGNFYYHFKTKDDILDAVIALRATRTQAMLHLSSNRFTIGEISFLLGFAHPNGFHKAFKRWTRMTPAQYREEALSSRR